MSPIIGDILKKFSKRYQHEKLDNLNHHEDTEWFMKYVESLVLSLKSNVDPFRIKDERLHNSSDYGQKGC